MSFVVDNHEDEEDENSGHKIHQHLQHQDDDIERVQSLIFILVARLNNRSWDIGQLNHIEPDFHNGDCDSDEGEQYGESSGCYQLFQVEVFCPK